MIHRTFQENKRCKIAILQQVAAIGHLMTEELINTLRKAFGQKLTVIAGEI